MATHDDLTDEQVRLFAEGMKSFGFQMNEASRAIRELGDAIGAAAKDAVRNAYARPKRIRPKERSTAVRVAPAARRAIVIGDEF